MNVQKLAESIYESPEEYIERYREEARLYEEITFPPQREVRLFVIREESCSFGRVRPVDVKGSYHPDYQGWTWEKFLRMGKRMSLNLRLLAENPWYYLKEDDLKLPLMSFIEFNGELFVRDDGNHRTAIARLFYAVLGACEKELVGVLLVKARLDISFFNAYRKLVGKIREAVSTPVLIEVERQPVMRKDAINPEDVSITEYKLYLILKNPVCGSSVVLSSLNEVSLFWQALDAYRSYVKVPWWKKIFRSFHYSCPEEWLVFLKTLSFK